MTSQLVRLAERYNKIVCWYFTPQLHSLSAPPQPEQLGLKDKHFFAPSLPPQKNSVCVLAVCTSKLVFIKMHSSHTCLFDQVFWAETSVLVGTFPKWIKLISDFHLGKSPKTRFEKAGPFGKPWRYLDKTFLVFFQLTASWGREKHLKASYKPHVTNPKPQLLTKGSAVEPLLFLCCENALQFE